MNKFDVGKVREYEKRRQKANAFNARVKLEVFARDNNRCVKCGSTEHLTVDHIIPVLRGGPSSMENVQTLCNSCNAGQSP